MTIKKYIWLGVALLAGHASAQVLHTDPDWKESEAPPPPAFNQEQLLPITMPSYVSLKFGLDPATLRITPDGIIRYVVVASNAMGSVSAMYEGIQCATWKVKTYARYPSSGQWSIVKDPKWQNLADNLPSKHAIALARQGICEEGSIAASSVANIIQSLKSKR
jgi:hypothetical protein